MDRRAPRLLGFLALLIALSSLPAWAQIASSSFAGGDDGWLNMMLPYPSAIPPTVLNTYTPTWVSSLGGYIRLNDPDGSGSSGDCQYWRAPDSYLGFKSAAYGGTLQFDLADAGSGYGPFAQEDILLIGGGLTLVHALGGTPVGAFTHYTIPMSEAGWKVGAIAGPPATVTQMKSVLFQLTALFIRAEHQLGPDVQYLDNVTLNAPASLGVEGGHVAALALEPPVPNPSRAITRFAFSLPREASGDVAIFEASGRRVATLVSGSFGAGPHRTTWSGDDASGRRVAPGLYWVLADFGSFRAARRFVRVE